MTTTTFLSMDEAVALIAAGQVVAIPTETVYGLAANAKSDEAVAKIYALKQRPQFNPLIVHVGSFAHAQSLTKWNDTAEKLTRNFWPGALTIVLKRRMEAGLSDLACAGLDTVAIRLPAHPVARQLIALSGLPIAAPSANQSGHVSPTNAEHVRAEFGDAVPVLEGGACSIGIESTIVDLTEKEPILLRHGIITKEQVERVIGPVRTIAPHDAIKAPGMLLKHYAPRKKLLRDLAALQPEDALLAFGPFAPEAKYVANLSKSGDLVEAAANLFAYLRLLDESDAARIIAMPVPNQGVGIAINDKLERASR